MTPNVATKPIPNSSPDAAAPQPSAAFPIVGIGASAGGLEALELFLQQVPVGCGMAFVIVQHLDPTRKGLMVEILQRCTRMKVMQVKDRTRVQPDCVFVIPPNKDMSILHGVLHLFETSSVRGLRLPIDYFLRSLAQDQQQAGISVILSGMGSEPSNFTRIQACGEKLSICHNSSECALFQNRGRKKSFLSDFAARPQLVWKRKPHPPAVRKKLLPWSLKKHPRRNRAWHFPSSASAHLPVGLRRWSSS